MHDSCSTGVLAVCGVHRGGSGLLQTRFEIEVYDPDPAKALDLVKFGDIQPVP
jgi:hypothetical protein